MTTAKKITAEQLQKFIKKIIKEQMEEMPNENMEEQTINKRSKLKAMYVKKAIKTFNEYIDYSDRDILLEQVLNELWETAYTLGGSKK